MKIHNNIIDQTPQIGKIYYMNIHCDDPRILPYTGIDISENKYYFGTGVNRVFIYR